MSVAEKNVKVNFGKVPTHVLLWIILEVALAAQTCLISAYDSSLIFLLQERKSCTSNTHDEENQSSLLDFSCGPNGYVETRNKSTTYFRKFWQVYLIP